MSITFIQSGRFASFNPTMISGCYAWYDASDDTTFSFSSGTVISQWRDKAGSSRHLGVEQFYEPSRSGTQNGLHTVVFNTDALGHTLRTVGGFGHGGSTLTLLTVMKIVTGSIAGAAFAVKDPGVTANWNDIKSGIPLYRDSGGKLSGFRNGGALTGTSSLPFDEWHVCVGKFDGNNWTPYLDGVAGTPRASSGNFDTVATQRFSISDDHNMDMEVAEIAYFNTALSDVDRNAIEVAWKSKWSTP